MRTTSGGECSEDDVTELVKEDEADGEEQAEKTKGKRRKAQSGRRKQSGLLLDEEEDGRKTLGVVGVKKMKSSKKEALGQRMQGRRK